MIRLAAAGRVVWNAAHASATPMRASSPNATLIEREDLHASLAVFRILADEGARFAFEPGQFARLSLGVAPGGDPEARAVLRSYSIASAPDPERPLEFFVSLVEGGAFTTLLFDLPLGSRLWVDPRAHGSFTLAQVPADAELVLVATGTGLAPYVSMLRTYAGCGRWRRMALIHGARRAADLGYREEIESLARRDGGVVYLPTLTREPAGSAWSGERGRVHRLLRPDALRERAGIALLPERTHVYLCGSPEMIREASAGLEARGLRRHRRSERGEIHTERYW